MSLVEQMPIPPEALPVQALRAHLRLGTGFGDDTLQDEILDASLRAAIAQVETLIGKAILRRKFQVFLDHWQDPGRQTLPRSPFVAVQAVRIVEVDGTVRTVQTDRFIVEQDEQRPALVAQGYAFPPIPPGGTAVVEMEAGYATEWAAVPPDLARAVVILAAHLYEDRSGETDSPPPTVISLLSPYRPVRIGKGDRS